MTSVRWIGTILGFAGIVLIFRSGLNEIHSLRWLSMVAIVIAAIFQASGLVALRKMGNLVHPVVLNFWSMLFGGLFLLATSIAVEDYSHISFPIKVIGSIVYLSSFSTVFTFVTYFWLAKHIEAVVLSLSAFITPIIAVFVGVIFMREVMTGNDYVGTVLVILGVAIATVGNVLKLFHRRTATLS